MKHGVRSTGHSHCRMSSWSYRVEWVERGEYFLLVVRQLIPIGLQSGTCRAVFGGRHSNRGWPLLGQFDPG
jgi:hypothetical protein